MGKKEGLPVHRHEHSMRASVYAYSEELDAWRKNRGQDKLGAQPSRDLNIPIAATEAETLPRPRRLHGVYLLGSVILAAAAALVVFSLVIHEKNISHTPYAPVILAVLPFENLSGGTSEGFLADGLTDDLITDFGKSGPVQVISRRSVMQFRGRRESLAEIARQLHATVILEGTTANLNGQVRITAQLMDATNDRLIWAQNYTRNTNDILSLQDDIAAQIAVAVSKILTTGSNPQGSYNPRGQT
jgi:TolB-like protein